MFTGLIEAIGEVTGRTATAGGQRISIRSPLAAGLSLGDSVAALFPDDPPSFYRRVPFGYHDTAQIEADLRAAGFADTAIETVSLTSRVDARAAAIGLCQGSPMGAEIEARGGDPAAVADAATAALARIDGTEMPMSAHVINAG